MTGSEGVRYSTSWLDVREQADARARSRELAADLAADVARSTIRSATGEAPLVVHDLGSGAGSMGRWLAPLLPMPQHWVLHDRDCELLAVARARPPVAPVDGRPVPVEARLDDVGGLTAEDLSGAGLMTASALLDVLTSAELDGLVAASAGARCPALLTLTVVGRVELVPAHPLDRVVAAAFDAHQRRVVAGRRLLGPDAVRAAAAAFTRCGARVDVRGSPWRLGRDDRALIAAWLRGWVESAREQCEERRDVRRSAALERYLERRLGEAADGALTVAVHHADLLVRWP